MRSFVVAALVMALPMTVAVVPTAHAEAATCQGHAATVEGPTGGVDTTGTEGDDVIVARIGNVGTVSGLGGNDLICLVDGGPASAGENDPKVRVLAGAGDDSVLNEMTARTLSVLTFSIELGTGADHVVGADFGELVFGASSDPSGRDTEPDVIDMRGGDDGIISGASGSVNHDFVYTGAGRDALSYVGAPGGSIDNGPGADTLSFVGGWGGELAIDNVDRRATVGNSSLTWTAIDGFNLYLGLGGVVTVTGSAADESLGIYGVNIDLAGPSVIAMGGGDDGVLLEGHLPARVAMGEGRDSLDLSACYQAVVSLADSVNCLTSNGQELSTDLAGIESFYGKTSNGLTVVGTARDERVWAFSRFVLVRSGPGADRVYAAGRSLTKVVGGRGEDRIKGNARAGTMLIGGRGSDVLRGSPGPDQLSGGLGNDIARGRAGRDLCVAEVRTNCELR